MEKVILNFLDSIETGEMEKYENVAVIPLFRELNHGPRYITLKEALEGGFAEILEVSQGGSVPELKVINKSELSILLIDGEEVIGAKQNRALNTSIFISGKGEILIPVSCTEARRWHYRADKFADSDEIISHQARVNKTSSVSQSLKHDHVFLSDQGRVWRDIEEKQAQYFHKAPTSALKELYEIKRKDFSAFTDRFRAKPGQKGIMVFIGGKVAGIEVVSLESSYRLYHDKILRSYLMEAMVATKTAKAVEPTPEKAKQFLRDVSTAKVTKHKSVAGGWDYRLEGEKLTGSALLVEDCVLHLVAFRV